VAVGPAGSKVSHTVETLGEFRIPNPRMTANSRCILPANADRIRAT